MVSGNRQVVRDRALHKLAEQGEEWKALGPGAVGVCWFLLRRRGRAAQVDPITPTLKPPGTKSTRN